MTPHTFCKFYNPEGLTEQESGKIYDFLVDFIYYGGKEFKPTFCRIVPSYEDVANQLRLKNGLPDIIGVIKSKRFLRNHYVLTSEMSGERLFVIDPTGIPTDKNNFHINIIPYFGLVSSSTGFHREVYSNLEEMDSWGTGIFPPNFHP